MPDFNRNEFENAIAFVCKHDLYFVGKEDEARQRLEHLIRQVLITGGRCTFAQDRSFQAYPNPPGAFFKVAISMHVNCSRDALGQP